ncbi:MAG: PAS domain S-box protein [Candidatus Electrothrix sp. ATG2]|nr:PAS domain S-box protein [Candidatus Electrothrix sp. ATG2]
MKNGIEFNSRRMAVVIQDSIDAITLQNLKGNILAWNRGAEKMYGYTEPEALTINILQIVPQDKIKETEIYFEKITSGQFVKSFETQRITKSGKILDVWLVVTCLKDDSGRIDSIATTERDITHLRNELREKEKEVQKLRSIIPICMHGKDIRDDEGFWGQVEAYISKQSKVDFSHSICPKCLKKHYPEYSKE